MRRSFSIIKDSIMQPLKSVRFCSVTLITPDNFVEHLLWTKNRIHYYFKVMASGRIAVQIYRSRAFQYSMQLNQTHAHICEKNHQNKNTKHRTQRAEHDCRV